ncbi:MAG TPA: ROK family transcriptional regulator [Steroidobacteraceae bacterium]|jgi:predicted NBD/HSP70 family sugar kinase|nr:ROK family transcriptional regulator [Steroidobacteraceae bacterium]
MTNQLRTSMPFQPMASVTRQLSRRSVFEALLHRSPISRADLAKVTGLSKQTTSEVIDAFAQQGLVRPVGRTSGNVGRTAVLYELSPEGGHVLGIDLGARVTVTLGDIAGRVLAETDEPTDSRGGAWALEQIARLADRLARDNHTHPSRIRSIVLATPGVVNPRTGAIEMAPNITGLGHLNVVGLLSEKLGSPVAIENDINLALLGEIWHGCAQNVANVAFLALGTGVGLGLYVNGQLVRGENGAAGEIGYLPIGGDPLQAEARLQGCLEYQVGAHGIVRRYHEAGGSEVESAREVFERAQAGDPLATGVIEETARLTALAAATVVATVDPQLIVLGGSVGARTDFADKVARVLLRLAPRPVEIRTSTLGKRAGVVGALSVALNKLHDELFSVADLAAAVPLPPPRVHASR